ncbi:MAG: response regulator [Alteromonadaceae bacterium]|nr:response regulator [Alteromonadaceae bacterium]
MLIDDDESILALIKRRLSGYGYQVTEFSNCSDALIAFAEAPDNFDLVISDFNMPEMTGIEFTEAVQAIVVDQPVIIITATPEQVIIDPDQDQVVISHVISKPIAFSELQTAILDLFPQTQPQAKPKPKL